MKILLILLLCLYLTQQAQLKTLDSKCICDITDECDSQCCCDSQCDSKLITQWKNYNLCIDDSLGIPFCSSLAQNDVNVLDLHSGLRTIYSVIKRLFCINSVNFVQPSDWYKSSPSDTDLQTQLSDLQSVQAQSSQNPNLESLSKLSIQNLPLKGSNGLCYSSSQMIKNKQLSSSCRIYIDSATNINQTLLSIQNIQSKIGTIKKYTTTSVSSISATNQTLQTSCSSSACDNVVRELKIFINTEDETINSNSYAVVGSVNIPSAAYINIFYDYSFVSTVNGETSFSYSAYKGYEFGSKLNLMYHSSGSYYKMFNSFNLAFKKLDGTCRTADTDQSANSFVQMTFGQSQVYSCIGSSNLIGQNIVKVFNMIGKYGLSTKSMDDFVNVTTQTLANTESVQVLIYYLNMGIPTKTQYQIQKVEIRSVTSKDGLSSLYIEYVDVENSYALYVPPAPTVDAYLPNDFLYPFYVA